MSVATQQGPRLSRNLRILSALSAVLLLLDTWQFSHNTRIQVAFGLTGALAWGWLAFFGDRPGWSHRVTAVLLVAFAALGVLGLGVRWV